MPPPDQETRPEDLTTSPAAVIVQAPPTTLAPRRARPVRSIPAGAIGLAGIVAGIAMLGAVASGEVAPERLLGELVDRSSPRAPLMGLRKNRGRRR